MDPAAKKAVLRKISYGRVLGYEEDTTLVPYKTTFFGLYDRARSFDEKAPYDLPRRYREGKDKLDLATPLDFVYTADTIGGRKYSAGPATKSPILEGFSCWLEAKVVDRVTKGDHTVFVAEVVEASMKDKDAAPLVLATTGWHYGG